jgi:small subunit ribosomal protein S4
VTGHNLLRYLDLRLDNVAFRAGWARTRPQARQFVSHGLLTVNGRRVTIPSIRLRAGDEIELSEKAQGR